MGHPESSLATAEHIPRVTAGLSLRQLIAFSSLMFPIMAAQLPIAVYLPSLYAQRFGMPLGMVGTIFLLERIWGTFTDPIVGMLSDRTKTRFGRRKPWIVCGTALFGIATVLLFIPFLKVTPLYLLLSLFTFYLAWSMMFIPYLAWSGELSAGYYERTRIATAQGVMGAIALLLVQTLPTIVDQMWPPDVSLKLRLIGATIFLSLAPTLFLTLRTFPEITPPPVPSTPAVKFGKTLRLVLRERALIRVFLSDFAVSMAQGIRATLIVFYVTFYVGFPKWASGLFLLQLVFGIAAGPIWAKISKRAGKHRTIIVAELIQAGINCALLLVMPGKLALLLALTIAQGLTQGSGNLMLRSMVADVADRHRLDTHVDRTALFFSIFSISQKAAMAAAVGVALPLVAWLGFNPAVPTNSPGALRALALVFALGPAVAHVFSAAFIRGFPIDEARYDEIRRALDIRDAVKRKDSVDM